MGEYLRLATKRRNLALLVGGVSCALIYFFLWSEPMVSDFAAGFTASFLIIVFVEGAIEAEQRRERHRVAVVALGQMRLPVTRMITLLGGWYKAAMVEPLQQVPSTMEDVFNESFFECVRHFNIQSQAGAILPQRSWLARSAEEIGDFQSDLGDAIGKYATFLSPRQIELAETAANCSLLNLIQILHRLPLSQIHTILGLPAPPDTFLIFQQSDDQLRVFVNAILNLRRELSEAGIEAGSVANLRLDDPKNPPVGTGRIVEDAQPEGD